MCRFGFNELKKQSTVRASPPAVKQCSEVLAVATPSLGAAPYQSFTSHKLHYVKFTEKGASYLCPFGLYTVCVHGWPGNVGTNNNE
jgi:hypothetical protein